METMLKTAKELDLKTSLFVVPNSAYSKLVFFPCDEGGCGCDRCRPWRGNGFLRISKAIKEMADAMYPGVEIALSTWCFNRRHHTLLRTYLHRCRHGYDDTAQLGARPAGRRDPAGIYEVRVLGHTYCFHSRCNPAKRGREYGREAARILKSVESNLTSYQRDAWRWRSFMRRVTGVSARSINYGVEPPRNRLGLPSSSPQK